MSGTSGQRAVDALVAIGLREYEAKCFVALAQLSEATAKEVSELADVPRSRVYDSMESLTTAGLVVTQQTKPIRYRGVPNEEAIDLVERDHRTRLDEAREALSLLEQRSLDAPDDEFGIWTLRQRQAITNRGEELIRAAHESVYVAAGRDYQAETRPWLEAAAELGFVVSGTLPTSFRREVRELLDPDSLEVSFVAEPRLDGINRLLVTDRGTALVAATAGGASGATAADAEAAIQHELGFYAEPTGLGPVVSRLVTRYVSSLSGTAGFTFEPGSG